LLSIPLTLPDITVQEVISTEATLSVVAVSRQEKAHCPDCHQTSRRVHSSYQRHPQDLPISGQTVRLVLRVRRFRCLNPDCSRKTCVERLLEIAPLYGQKTTRLRATLTMFALTLSAEAGERLLCQIGMAASADILLRLAKGARVPSPPAPVLLGVDDFAFRRGSTYGTILVDLSTHRPIDLLPERTADALSAWLKAHPGVQWISRDRSGEYARGAGDGAPEARQMVDRWHLLKNWREVLQRVVGRVHGSLKQRQTASGMSIRPRYKLSRSSSEVAASQASRLRRLAVYEEVVGLHQQGAGSAPPV
jgi:transposase